MTERLEIYLSGCQVGTTVCSVELGVVAEPGVATAFVAKYGAPTLFGWRKVTIPSISLSDWATKALQGPFGVSIERP